jgi:hypothetical protein
LRGVRFIGPGENPKIIDESIILRMALEAHQGRDGEGGQNADNHHHDHDLHEGKAMMDTRRRWGVDKFHGLGCHDWWGDFRVIQSCVTSLFMHDKPSAVNKP